jgi:hypothetical protein
MLGAGSSSDGMAWKEVGEGGNGIVWHKAEIVCTVAIIITTAEQCICGVDKDYHAHIHSLP